MSDDTIALLARMRADLLTGEAKRIRELLDLSQAEVASEVRIKQPTLSAWETGRRRPTGAAAARYARVLGRMRVLATAQQASAS